MRSHFTQDNGDHVFNPNTEGVTDEGHILSVTHCPICNEEEEAERAAEECDACGCLSDEHDARNPYGASVQVTCMGCEDCGEDGDNERYSALAEKRSDRWYGINQD
jgi:hypothetical protein